MLLAHNLGVMVLKDSLEPKKMEPSIYSNGVTITSMKFMAQETLS